MLVFDVLPWGLWEKPEGVNKYDQEAPGHPSRHYLGLLKHGELNRVGRTKYSRAPNKTLPTVGSRQPQP